MASGDINLTTYARHLKSGRFGGRAIFHVAPIVRDVGLNATRQAIGADLEMRNLFQTADPVTAGVKYSYEANDECVVKLRPSGMFTIMERQGSGNPLAAMAAVADNKAMWSWALQKVIDEDY